MYIYDFEVLTYDWLVVFFHTDFREFICFHNNPYALQEFMTENRESVFIGFNSKHYDQWIMKAILAGGDNEDVKAMNDYLIAGGNGWEHPYFKQNDSFYFNNVDIMDDMQQGLSLKAIEGHLGMSIEESSISFDLNRPLTDAEVEELTAYCKHDVEATYELVVKRKDYLSNKIRVGAMAGLDEKKSQSLTNAKLTAAFLQAKPPKTPRTDERKYVYPENLKREYIPQEVFDFFDRMYDESIPDEDLFSAKLEIEVGGTPTVLGYGGIHSAIPNYVDRSDENGIIINFDVGSYYPHLMTVNGYTSRNIPNPQVYADMLEKRMEAKKAGDKVTANALKLIANTTYGATLNKYNDLYDPLMARSVCISGQLYLLELSEHLVKEVPDLRIVQTNTDGIMVKFPLEQAGKVLDITIEWERRTGFELEQDAVASIAQKDVNNYVEVGEDGTVKKKGGYVVRGIAPAGAFNVNNNAVIVAEAISDYFTRNVPVESTINSCNNTFKFQLIAKAGSKYKEAYHIVDGKKLPVQKVNRVYAALDPRYGKLHKVKAENDQDAQIESLPEHCLIDNSDVHDPNHTCADQIDKQWYIDLAKKRINDFLGIKPQKNKLPTKGQERMDLKPMATTSKEAASMNVYLKLLNARAEFLDAAVKKSGKNMKLRYSYFELDDIVPSAMPIFMKWHLMPQVYFPDEHTALMKIIDCDKPEDQIVFSAPLKEIDPIISSTTGGEVTNAVQRLGSAITYMRRYLYMLALDIVEADEMEARAGETEAPAVAEAPKPKIPATPMERQEIKQELTQTAGNADELLIQALKTACEKFAAAGYKEQVTQIALQTENYTRITRADCEKLIGRINELLAKK